MPRTKVKKLSSLFGSVVKSTPSSTSSAVTSTKKKLRSPPPPPPPSPGVKSSLRKQPPHQIHQTTGTTIIKSHTLNEDDHYSMVNGSAQYSAVSRTGVLMIHLIQKMINDNAVEADSDLPWFSNLFNSSTSLRLGSGSTFELLYKLGRGTGLKEYHAFIKGCIETARNSKDEKVQAEQILEAYRVLQLMKERGFPIVEDAFGPFFMYLIDMHMDEQFLILLEIVKEEDPSLHPRLGYYEMLFYIEMNNDEKVQELCQHIAVGQSEMGSLLHENYLLALCERDRKELLQLLDIVDISRVSSLDNVAIIFRSLGRLSLEAFAELFILVLKDCGTF
ncbi:hypothetical protein RDABS01_032214 [Bienertia sinuspersici]